MTRLRFLTKWAFLPATTLLALAMGISQLADLPSLAAEPEIQKTKSTVGPKRSLLKKTRNRAVNYLRNSQADDGSWTTPNAPGISALATAALLENGLPPDDPTVARALKHLKTFIQKDGGIYYSKSNHRNYETCISLMAFQLANIEGEYDKVVANAVKFLRV